MSEGWLIAHYVWTYGGDAALLLCVAAAFRWGGPPERAAAVVLLVGAILTFIVTHFRLEPVEGLHPLVMVIDIAALAGFVWLSLRSRRPAIVLMAAFQLNDVLTYPAAWLSRMDTFTFVTALGFWGGWGLVLILAWGIWDHARRGRQAA